MSRNYSVICMNHTPALRISDHEWYARDLVAGAVRDRELANGQLADHKACRLIIAEYSGGLIGFGQVTANAPHGTWIDIEWARLLYAAHLSGDGAVAAALESMPMYGRDWTYERLHALRDWLGGGAETWG
jgi:hypothetical protein